MLARLRGSIEENDEGFTLIELLIVMVVLGILATIAFPVLDGQRKKGWDTSAKADLRNAAAAQETYLAGNSTYTATLTDLTGVGFKPTPGVVFADGYFYTRNPAGTPQGPPVKASGSFCMTMQSRSGSWFVYDSSLGGLRPSGAICS